MVLFPHVSTAIRSLEPTTGHVLLDQQAADDVDDTSSKTFGGWLRASDPATGMLFVADEQNAYLKTGDRLLCMEGKPINNGELFLSDQKSPYKFEPLCRHLFYVSRGPHSTLMGQESTSQETDKDKDASVTPQQITYWAEKYVQENLELSENTGTKYEIVGCEVIGCHPEDPLLKWKYIKLTAAPSSSGVDMASQGPSSTSPEGKTDHSGAELSAV